MQMEFRPAGILSCLKHIIQAEGVGALFKGLGPTLVGVAPSRAVYFSMYAKMKQVLNRSGFVIPDSKCVHIGSACSAGEETGSVKIQFFCQVCHTKQLLPYKV